MALTLDCASTHTISLEECYESAATTVDPYDVDSIIAFAPQLRQLANDRSLLINKFNNILRNYKDYDFSRAYAPHSFPLTSGSSVFMIRANIWAQLATERRRRKLEERFFAYNRAHDHNFNFLTVGYSGPGYDTDIYEYDSSTTEGFIGEKVEMKFLERTSLPVGKVMLYRRSKDIHLQLPPSSLSASLNLLITTPEDRLVDQYYFDHKLKVISEYSETVVSKRVSLLRMAGIMANSDTVDMLEHIAKNHYCPRTRLQAYKSLSTADREGLERYKNASSLDKASMVRSFARVPVRTTNPSLAVDGTAKHI